MFAISKEESTIRIPTIELISNGTVESTASINYLDIVQNYYEQFYDEVKVLGCRIILEQLQANYRIKTLFRSVRYLDKEPLVMQSNADKIANILNFENDYRVDTGHAIELDIKDEENRRRSLISYYNFGLNNNQSDLITPYLTVNDVDMGSRNSGLNFELTTPASITSWQKTDYFSITGCFIFQGKIYYSTLK